MYKKIFINSIIIFLLSFLLHDLYSYLPNFITSIFASVNESIWEHQKMIFTSYMLYILIIYLFYKKKPNNYVSSNVIGSLINIGIFLVIYIPIYKLFGENMILTLIIYFISIIIANYFIYKFQERKNNRKLNSLLGFSIILIYLIFTLLSYYPPRLEIFFDPTNKIYGMYKFK